jgi:hypothetical protein
MSNPQLNKVGKNWDITAARVYSNSNTNLTLDASGNSSLILKTNGTNRLTIDGAGLTTFGTLGSYDPATNFFTATKFVGDLSGNATNSTSITITDTNTAGTFYPTFVSAAGASQTLRADITTTPLTYNPNTGMLTTTQFTTGGSYGSAQKFYANTSDTSPLQLTTTGAVYTEKYFRMYSGSASTNSTLFIQAEQNDAYAQLQLQSGTTSGAPRVILQQYVDYATSPTFGGCNNILDMNGNTLTITNGNAPSELPEPNLINIIEEPYIKAQIITKSEYTGVIMSLCMDKRGILKNQIYLTTDRVELTFDMPLSEVVFDFFDRLKTISRGYASLDYEYKGYEPGEMVKLDIMLNGEKVDALSAIVHRDKAYDWGKRLCEKLRELLPRQQFEIAIQAAIGQKIIARETVKALRKDVLAKCYGGDISRKRKLLEKQKKGKKRMRQVGNVEIPQEAFMAVLKLD